jgi:hypothetical protein
VHLDEALRVRGGLEPPYPSFPFARWLMRNSMSLARDWLGSSRKRRRRLP